jgi:beta-N-acetylhexosaminidase
MFSDDLSMEGARRLDGHLVSHAEAAWRRRCRPAATWCCCATRAWATGAAVDALLDGLADAQAQGRWQPSPDSAARRLALLPGNRAAGLGAN